jgi:hypothetical protein
MIARVLALLAAGCTLAAAAQGLSKDEYKTQRVRVQDQLATRKDRCSSVAGHSREVCKAQAQAEYDVARAELLARFKPTPRNQRKAELAKATSSYRVAVEKCGDLEGPALKICRDDAASSLAAAKAEVRARRCEGLAGDAKAACVSETGRQASVR